MDTQITLFIDQWFIYRLKWYCSLATRFIVDVISQRPIAEQRAVPELYIKYWSILAVADEPLSSSFMSYLLGVPYDPKPTRNSVLLWWWWSHTTNHRIDVEHISTCCHLLSLFTRDVIFKPIIHTRHLIIDSNKVVRYKANRLTIWRFKSTSFQLTFMTYWVDTDHLKAS